MTLGDVNKEIAAHGVTDPVVVYARRGYYGPNRRGVFDDLICVRSKRAFKVFRGNTDPTDPDTDTRLATLQPGVWHYQLGIHGLSKPKEKQYKALVQAAPVTVLRDNDKKETGWFGINIHHAGVNTTTSAGCQTIWRPQWDEFFALVTGEMAHYGMTTIPYILTVNPE